MGIFSSIKDAIFGDDEKDVSEKEPPKAPIEPTTKKVKRPEREAISQVDVAKRLDAKPGSDKLNWRTSIVDLMKLVGIDSSYEARQQLADELGLVPYSGTAEQNMALHRAVMNKIALAGGQVPPDLRD
ncbi:DUF3597 domain-containing protein [Erythrobacter sp.]|jgi:hypothetical protein|uniref:DUF3597 domain-containing protein n=1 Tax=Erythrobacter sp. TaxID=1042 RepID=UPI002EA1C1D9|nr:DUF3597 domain-containing protein [Erythrobacter sp.]